MGCASVEGARGAAPACCQHLLNAGNDLLQYARFAETVAATPPDFPHWVADSWLLAPLGLSCDLHGYRDNSIELVHVRNVIDKGLRFAGVQKPDCWCVACSQNGRFG